MKICGKSRTQKQEQKTSYQNAHHGVNTSTQKTTIARGLRNKTRSSVSAKMVAGTFMKLSPLLNQQNMHRAICDYDECTRDDGQSDDISP